MFFFRKSKIVLDMFTDDSVIHDLTPPLPAVRYYPQWMKDLPVEKTKTSKIESTGDLIPTPAVTIRACPGIHNYFGNGFIVPLWTDVTVSINPDGMFSFASAGPDFKIESHWPGQWSGYDDYTHMKFIVPWLASEKTGIEFMLQKPVWVSNDNPILISKMVNAGGIANLRDQHSVHLNCFFEKPPQPVTFMLKLGTPLVHIIPLTEKRVILKTHLVSKEELRLMWRKKMANTFTNTMLTRLSLLKSLKDESKCPYKF
jgi:hypothetical protein